MRIAVGILVGLITSSVIAASPAGAGFVKPDQHFIGVVNGPTTSTAAVPVVHVVCASTATTGRAAPGQTLSVHATSAGKGYTGPLSQVFAWFDQDARSPEPAEVTFHRYDTARGIPAATRLPCTGVGTVTFSPCPRLAPCVAGWESMSVTVRFTPAG